MRSSAARLGWWSLIAGLSCLALFSGMSCGQDSATGADTLHVAAAASLTDAIEEIADAHARRTGESVEVVTGASSTLARQIQSGAPYDVFVSAHPDWIDVLAAEGLTRERTTCEIASNALAVIQPKGAAGKMPPFDAALLAKGRWALADPAHVPAGVLAREAIEAVTSWSAFEGRAVPAANVRAALRLVETGAVDFGIVYRTDALASDAVAIVGEVPAEIHGAPRVVATALGRGGERGEAFVRMLASPGAQAALRARGFGGPALD